MEYASLPSASTSQRSKSEPSGGPVLKASCLPDCAQLALTSSDWRRGSLLFSPDPVPLGRARLLSAGSFRAASLRLAPRGALVVSLRTASAEMTGATAALGGSLFGPLRAAFPVVRATPGSDTLLVAGFDGSAVTLDPAVVAARTQVGADPRVASLVQPCLCDESCAATLV